MKRYRIRPATAADHTDWCRLRWCLWPDDTEEHHGRELESLRGDEYVGFLAVEEDTGRAVGFAEVAQRPYANGCETRPVAFLEGIWVDPPARGKGVGRQLVEAAAAWARDRGLKELGSDSPLDNKTSRVAHTSWGFEAREEVAYFRLKL